MESFLSHISNFNSILRFYLKGIMTYINYPEHLSRRVINWRFKDYVFSRKKLLTIGTSISRFKFSTGISSEKTTDVGSSDEKLRNILASTKALKLIKITADEFLTNTGLGITLKACFIKQ